MGFQKIVGVGLLLGQEVCKSGGWFTDFFGRAVLAPRGKTLLLLFGYMKIEIALL